MTSRIRQFALLGLLVALALSTGSWARAQDPTHPPETPASEHPAPAGDAAHPAPSGDSHSAQGHGKYTIWNDLPLWSAIAFIGFVAAIFKLGLWDSLTSNMSKREAAERGAISTAEGHLTEAQTLLRSAKGRIEALDESVRETLAEGQRDAQYTRDEFIRLAEKEAAASVERARYEVERVKNQSLNDLFESLADKVATVTEQRLKGGLQADDQRRLIETMLGQFSRN